MITVYVLANIKNKIYIGQTNNLERRLFEHNSPNRHFTGNRGPWRLIYKEDLLDKKSAIKREKELKSSRGRCWIKNKFLTQNVRRP